MHSSRGFEAPTDSIEELGFNTDIEDEVMQHKMDRVERVHNTMLRRASQSAGGAPRPETYSKPL